MGWHGPCKYPASDAGMAGPAGSVAPRKKGSVAAKNKNSVLVNEVYEARRDRRVHPEGTFDDGGRWYPSDREDADGSGSSVRSPSRAWPYSYMLRCRTKAHGRVLVERALAGEDVPADVAAVVRSLSAAA